MEWRKQEIAIPTERDRSRGMRWQRVPAIILGPLAIHTDLSDEHKMALTHTPTMLRVAAVATDDDAIKIARFLHARFLAAFSRRLKQDVCYRLPNWVKYWLQACTVAAGWVEPAKFQKDFGG